MDSISHPLKYTFNYASSFIFLIGIIIYMYLIIIDHLYPVDKHSVEDLVWIYSMFVILILGFIVSSYHITRNIYC
jgi:hypothetical protein